MAQSSEHTVIPEKLRSLFARFPQSKMCSDCSDPDPDWASLNLGAFLCRRCAGAHRSLGTHISQVRSLKLDSWTEEELALMLEHIESDQFPDISGQLKDCSIQTDRNNLIEFKYTGVLKRRSTGSPAASEQDRFSCGILKVNVLKGVDMAIKDIEGTSDPYCILSVGPQKVKTKVKKKTLNPVWNEQFMFNIADCAAETLLVHVMDKDLFTNDDSMGTAEISLKGLQNGETKHIETSLVGEPGTLHLDITYYKLD